jgi:hypothetical protein
MRAHGVEERLRGGPSEIARLALLQGGDDLVLLRGAARRERFAMGFTAIAIERGEPAPIEILLAGISAGQRKIDVIEHTGVAGARLAGCSGHQPLGEFRNRNGKLVIEERAVRAWGECAWVVVAAASAAPCCSCVWARVSPTKRVPATAPTAAPTKNARRDSSCLLMRIASLRYELACSQQEVCARFRFGRQDDGPAVLTYQGGRRVE